MFPQFLHQPHQIGLQRSQVLFPDNGLHLTFVFVGFIAHLERVQHDTFLFAEDDGFCLFVLFLEFFDGVVINIFTDAVLLEGVAFGEETRQEKFLSFVELDLEVVHGAVGANRMFGSYFVIKAINLLI